MDHAQVQQWLDHYIAAWVSYDPDDIGALFSEDIEYRYHPHDEPIRGRAAVVASWLDEGEADDSPSTRDEPGTFEARYQPVAVDGDVVVARGVSEYRDVPDGPIMRVYDNCFLMRFDDDGRCREFTEFFVERPSL
ncbi:nuclear transport factor 2 family protein [Salinibacterium sp. G-O1]|uniref:nuclear transport factor 2 family protein n=1 Tax=Salinibacterium sp. G-O1 TaxID=3046208 RepID=UPI0024B88334|nr:nuclear transport factor 2 family protein [Salinibacterium sp. G-O1]MDJ0334116.1 nuclear transport factor 2 family protein [Salinibacterium sp. G-O1]